MVAAPVVLVAAALAAKMVYFSVAADPGIAWYRSLWWMERTLLASSGTVGTLLLLLAPLLFLPRGRRLPLLWAAGLMLSLLVYADVLYVRYFGDVLSVAALTAAGQLGMITSSILALVKPADLLFFADLLVLPLFVRSRGREPAGRPARQAALVLLGAGAALSVYPVATILRRGEYDYFKLRGASKIGLFNYHVYDLAINLDRGERQVTPAERVRARAVLERTRGADPRRSELFGIARGSNLILVMVEALHAFPLGLVANGVEVTPHLNALARRSITFENFYDQTWHGVTSDGEFTALQSLHPLAEGGVPTRYGTHRFFALPHVLARNGYTTLSAHGFSGAIWMMSTAHPAYGIQQSWFRERFDQREQLGMGLSDASFFRQVMPRLAGEREPFMAFLVTLSTHFPYKLPAPLRTPALAEPEGSLLAAYLQSVYQLDRAIGELVAGLERSGLLDRSVLAVFGDHVAFGDADELVALLTRYARYPERRAGFDPAWWRTARRLPLIIHLPGDAAAGVRSGSAGHLDIAPTLLTLLGIAEPRMPALGRDLTMGGSSLVVFRDGSFVVGDTVCVRPSAAIAAEECRLLDSGAVLAPEALRDRFWEARERLATSDVLLRGNLIPWAAEIVAGAGTSESVPGGGR
jgi:lipoteichoic acid synthase